MRRKSQFKLLTSFPVYSEDTLIEMEYLLAKYGHTQVPETIDARKFVQWCDLLEKELREEQEAMEKAKQQRSSFGR